MTHSGGKPHTNVGDKGQRYEVSFNDEGQRRVMGWANHLEGVASMLSSIEAHPSWDSAQIKDRTLGLLIAIGDIREELS